MEEKIMDYLIEKRREYRPYTPYTPKDKVYVKELDSLIINNFKLDYTIPGCGIFELDFINFTYRDTFTHEWLYINPPMIISSDELLMKIRFNKLKNLN